MKECNIKCHYCIVLHKISCGFDGIECQLQFDKIKQFKKFLNMQEVFHADEKYIELVKKLSFEISEVIQEKKSFGLQ